MKNRVIKNGENYILETKDGEKFICSRWFEKKTNAWHVKLPKDNPTGRIYIRESHFANSDIYEFEDKTEHRTGLATGGWRAKMTEEEKRTVEECEKTIERIKNDCMNRETKKPEKNTIEWYEAEIARLMAKKNRMESQGN